MQKINIILFAAIAVVFAGCASAPKPAAYDDSHSKAWNIATAAGLKNVKDYVVKDHTDLNTAALGGVYAGLSQLPGVSFSVTDIGVGMLSSILASGVKPQEAIGHMFIWMPAEMANTPLEARTRAVNNLSKVFKKVAPKFIGKNVKENIEEVGIFADKRISAEYYVPDTKVIKEDATFGVYEPTPGFSPLWLGGHKIWRFGLENGQMGTSIYLFTKRQNTEIKFSVAVSKNLPNYFYIYLPATTEHGPMIINQGKILPFAKPKSVASK